MRRSVWDEESHHEIRILETIADASQYRDNPKACVYFYDKRFFKGVMLTGTMEVLRDSRTRKMRWREGDEMYYPKGVTDPDYCVLRFTAQSGRYYSHFQSENFEVG